MPYKRFLTVLLILTMLLTPVADAFASSSAQNDIKGHWAEAIILDWVNKDLIKGYPDNTIRPDSSISRAEFVTMVNRVFKLPNNSSKPVFTDVPEDDWFSGAVSAAADVGYINGYSKDVFRPYETVTREQAAAIIARLLILELNVKNDFVSDLKDNNQLSDWSLKYIEAILAKGIMKGYEDKTFQPGKGITRAEAIVTINRALSAAGETVVYGKPGTYGPEEGIRTINGNVVISSSEVILQNTVITGNLLFATGIGEGKATIKNVNVKGNTVVRGGGPNSITLKDCTLRNIVVAKDGVRLVVLGNTSVEAVQLESGATLMETDLTGTGFGNLTVAPEIPYGALVNLFGDFDQVNVQASINMSVQSGTVADMNIAKSADGATVILLEQAAVKTLNIDGRSNIKGEGKIETAYINSSNTVIEQTPARVVVLKGVTANVGGRELSEGTTIIESPGLGSPGAVSTEGITIDQQDLVKIVGETVQLTVTFEPDTATNESISWHSNNEAVATVSPSGLLKAVNEGMAIITAISDGKKAITILTVKPDPGLLQLPAVTEGFFSYTVTNGKAEVTGYSPEGPKEVVIPNTLGGYKVTSIGAYCFNYKWINSVRIPDGVTNIGNSAFSANNLTTLDIPDGVVHIGNYAFGINKLTSVTIPNGVISLEDYAFCCNYIRTAIIPESVTSIGSTAFWENQQNAADLTIFGSAGSTAEAHASSLHYTFKPGHIDYDYTITNGEATLTDFNSDGPKDIVIPGKLGGYPVTSIGQNAFAYSQLSSLSIPYSVKSIEDHAFANSQIQFVSIPCSVTSIGDYAFADSQIPAINIPNSVTSIGKSAFAGSQLTTVVIPGSVTSISSEAFAGSKLSSVIISNGVTSIGDLAFSQNCLSSVVIPDSVTSIGTGAFNGNQLKPLNFLIYGKPGSAAQVYADSNGHSFVPAGLSYNIINGEAEITGYSSESPKDIVIPETILGYLVTSIANGAFQGKQLTSVTIPSGVKRIGDYAFYQNQLVSVTIPSGVTTIGMEAFNSNLLTSVVIPDSVTSIGGWAFQNNQLTSATLPKGLTRIETSLFAGNHLTSISIPFGVTRIGDYAFLGNQLTSVSIPGSVTDIGGFAFTANVLTSVVIPGSVQMIGNYAFSQNSIKCVQIPKSVIVIGENAFWLNQDYNPQNLVFYGTAGSVAQNYAISNKHTFVVLAPGDPAGFIYTVTGGKGKITGYCADAKDVVIPRTLGGYPITSIGDNAFRGINSVIIPDCITSIGGGAFACSNLVSVTIPNSVTSIGWSAFAYNKLTSVTIPTSVTSIGSNAFAYNSLTSVTIPKQVTTIGDGAFAGNQQKPTDLIIYGTAGSAAETYARSNGNCFVQPGDAVGFVYSVTDGKGTITGYSSYAPRDVVIPGTLGGYPIIGIEDFVFCDTGITSVSMPGSLKSIGAFSFYGNRINTLILSQGVTSIGDVAFWGNGMTFVIIPDSVTSIGHNALCGNLLTTVTIPDSVISIGSEAFEGNRLTSVFIPGSVTSIGDRAFSENQQNPKDLIIYGVAGSAAETYANNNGHTFVEYNFEELKNYTYTVTGMEAEITAYASTYNKDIVIPFSLGGYPVTGIARGTFQGKQLTSVKIPNSIKSIGDDAFKENQLTSVIVPEDATSIGSNAFAFNQLKTVTIPQSVTSIGADAFSGNQQIVSNLKIFGIAGSIAEAYAKTNGYTFVPLLTYTVTDGKAKITGYSLDAPKDAVIPGTLGGYPVTGIDELAFAACQLTSVSIPDSVTSIGNSAFMHNELKSVILPESVTNIGSLAFASNQLTSVKLPGGLTSIGTGVFDSNQLTSVEIPASVTSIGEYAFGWNRLTSIAIPVGVTSIGSSAFKGNQLTALTIPQSVVSIGADAFSSNQLTTVNISGSLTDIAPGIFENNRLTSVTIPVGVTSIGSSAFKGNQLAAVTIPEAVTSIGAEAFAGNQLNPAALKIYGVAGSAAETYASSNGHYFIKYDPQDLLRYTFTITGTEAKITGWNSTGASELVIPGNLGGYTVTDIGNDAFQSKQLISVVIPDSVTSIGSNAFKGNRLSEVTISASVMSIGVGAFEGNQQNPAALVIYGAAGSAAETYANSNGYTFVDLMSYVYTITGLGAEITAYNPTSPGSVTIPGRLGGYPVTSIGDSTFMGKQLNSVILPGSIRSIGDSAFNQNQLTTIIIPDGVTSIGRLAFASNQLTTVIIPSSVTIIGEDAFANNSVDLIIYGLPGSAAELYAAAHGHTFLAIGITFTITDEAVTITGYSQSSPKNVMIPVTIDGYPVTGIGNRAFSGLQLTSVSMSYGIISIGTHAFSYNSLMSVSIPESVTSIGYAAFYCNKLTSLSIADSVHTIDGFAFGWNSLTSLVIPASVTSIGNYAFYKNQLTSLVISDGLTSIGANAFLENQLSSVTIPSSVTSIASDAFKGNQANPADLTIYGVPGSAAEAYANSNGHTFVPL